jgi:hypothetical protein
MVQKIITSLVVVLLVTTTLFGQSGREFRRNAVHNANQVRTVFGNWGVIGQPSDGGPRGAWRHDNNGYLGDVSPFVGAEVKWDGLVFRSVVTSPVDRPTALRDEDPQTGRPWAFEPVSGYFNPNQQKIAMSTDRNSWPQLWPDKMGDPSDPGWRGSWNGYFGKRINADQESYFVMDDNNDERFNFANNNPRRIAFKPDANNSMRNGLALEVRVRGMQWAQFLAKDNIFWLYEITNTGTTDYDRVVFGMLVGTYVGVTGTDDSPGEYDDDWSFYDVVENITYTGDFPRDNRRNPLWQGPVGMVGYAFLESPGNPFDGIDNDGDAEFSPEGSFAPLFTATSFDSTLINPGDRIILIRDDFSRYVYTVPNVDTVTVYTRGMSFLLRPGVTKVAEGNILRDIFGNEFVNPNAYDGIDNDFDGIIDENFYLHYRQIKRTRTVPPKTLIDILRPVRYIDYATGAGTSPYSMIDERRDDRIDNDRDWNEEFDDVGRDGIPNTQDYGEGDGLPTSGYDDFGNDTGLPGEPNIDKTDVSESDQIGLTSFYYFVPAGDISMGNDEALWGHLEPGFFDVPQSIVNNRPEAGEDGDFVYGSGYFPLLAGATERFSLALVYGGGKGGTVNDDIADLLKNKQTVQKIYDSNYQFPTPPDKPTLTAVPGDRQVTLYWDRKAEESIDPVLRIKDFEGYKIYRSTDPNFSDIFTITDADGSPQGYRPLAQFDLKNGITGYFRADPELFQGASGYSFYLGNDSGLQHSFVDVDVENGRRYFYAVVAYDRGDESIGIFPSENTKFVTILPTGEVFHDQNVAVVVPNAKVAGYVPPEDAVALSPVSKIGTGDVYYRILDQTALTGFGYRLEFLDTLTDSLDNYGNDKIDAEDKLEWIRLTSSYSVRTLDDLEEMFVASADTARIFLENRHLIPETVTIKNAEGMIIPSDRYLLDAERGVLQASGPGTLPAGEYIITYQYYPVYRSPYILGSPFHGETRDADIFDGLTVEFDNNWNIRLDETTSGWVGTTAYVYNFAPVNTSSGGQLITGYRNPMDYEIQFFDRNVDLAYWDRDLTPGDSVSFRVYNKTEGKYIKFIFADLNMDGRLGAFDEIVFLEENPLGEPDYSWSVYFINRQGEPTSKIYDFNEGDKLVLNTTKPFRRGDVFEFRTELPSVDETAARDQMDRIRVVPNPYVTASSFEPPLPPGITSGRGQRKIDFIYLPAQSVVHIFTARGEHVITLEHSGNIEDGTVSWNLKTKENLDIAYGVYFYVVESPVGKKVGKLAIIK